MRKNIDFEKLEQLYNAIKAIDAENDALRKALRAMNVENEFFGSDNVHALEKLAYTIALGGDEQLIDDFEYLLYETPSMADGGSITVDGKKYKIREYADLLHYWTGTGVVGDG
jgi:hypothetical protein